MCILEHEQNLRARRTESGQKSTGLLCSPRLYNLDANHDNWWFAYEITFMSNFITTRNTRPKGKPKTQRLT